MAFVFWLAISRNMRSGGTGTPARLVSFLMEATRSGYCWLRGSNLLNRGSITRGMITMYPRSTSTKGTQESSHQRLGLYRMKAKRIDANTIPIDRKSTRLNSSHMSISYAVFCLKKKKKKKKA